MLHPIDTPGASTYPLPYSTMTKNDSETGSDEPETPSSRPGTPTGPERPFTPTGTGLHGDRTHDSTRTDPAGDTNFASPPPSTGGPVDPDTIPKPAPAKMGTTKWDGFSHWVIQMGETPNIYWTAATPPTVYSPFQLRGTPKTDGIKPLLERRGKGYSPPKIKITKRSNLFQINEKLKRHIKDHGMYTITCLPDPRNPRKEMVSVLDHSSLFTVAEANKAVQPYLPSWDDYDKSNNADCKLLLESLMDTTLWDELKGREDSPFPVLYIELCSLLQPKSKDYFDGISRPFNSSHRVVSMRDSNKSLQSALLLLS